ncbi:hypothetical protein FHR81_005011 [Actinoalloteichus hoggarensis]|uniref:Uncharacterized protein n=1 Tax=Actinoalloteichus hoggarensis TaxID=1470176 RepID=A0A221W7P3_9PSEU|nr:hypothetical protein [Actinoalloteichus hoggarensis]ASO21982.1 hypothetical protein AHOG_21830 [Actinoalloteichus hoggarensis]MBB5923938.1 hypothetical protein [Actinoalloteichus hoggarensis]
MTAATTATPDRSGAPSTESFSGAGPSSADRSRCSLQVSFSELAAAIRQRLGRCGADEKQDGWRRLAELVDRLAADSTTRSLLVPGGDGESSSRCAAPTGAVRDPGMPDDIRHGTARPSVLVDGAAAAAGHGSTADAELGALPSATQTTGPRTGAESSAEGPNAPPACLRRGVDVESVPRAPMFGRPVFLHPATTLRGRLINEAAETHTPGGSSLGASVDAVRAAVEAARDQAQEAFHEFHRVSAETRAAVAEIDRRHDRPNVPALPLPPWPDVHTDIDRWWFRAGLAKEARSLPRLSDDLTSRARATAARALAAIRAWERTLDGGDSGEAAIARPCRPVTGVGPAVLSSPTRPAPPAEETPTPVLVSAFAGRPQAYGAAAGFTSEGHDTARDGATADGTDPAHDRAAATAAEHARVGNTTIPGDQTHGGDPTQAQAGMPTSAAVDGAATRPTARSERDLSWLTNHNGGVPVDRLRTPEAAVLREALAELDAVVAFDLTPLGRLTTGVDGTSRFPNGIVSRFVAAESRFGGDPSLRSCATELCSFLLSPALPELLCVATERLDRDRRWQDDRRAALAPLVRAARSHAGNARLLGSWIEVAARLDTLEADLMSERPRVSSGRPSGHPDHGTPGCDVRPRNTGPRNPHPRR